MDHKGAIDHILDRLTTELSSHLLYHGHHHTLDVLEAAERIANHEKVSAHEMKLLLVAAAYHDCGFLTSYVDHELAGVQLFSAHFLNMVLIRMTLMPSAP
jgi:uncharacterized protein